MPPKSVKATVPSIYQLVLTTIEPLLTLLGVLATIGNPTAYVAAVSGSVTLWQPRLHFLFTQLCGAWLVLAFNGAVVLRLVDDRRTWTLVCGGMLLSDIIYAHSCAEAMGGWAKFVQTSEWRTMDWVVFLTSVPLGIVRALFLMKVGFRTVPMQSRKDQ